MAVITIAAMAIVVAAVGRVVVVIMTIILVHRGHRCRGRHGVIVAVIVAVLRPSLLWSLAMLSRLLRSSVSRLSCVIFMVVAGVIVAVVATLSSSQTLTIDLMIPKVCGDTLDSPRVRSYCTSPLAVNSSIVCDTESNAVVLPLLQLNLQDSG